MRLFISYARKDKRRVRGLCLVVIGAMVCLVGAITAGCSGPGIPRSPTSDAPIQPTPTAHTNEVLSPTVPFPTPTETLRPTATSAPVETPAPQLSPAVEPTDNPAIALARAGVTRNADWTPCTEVINGVEMALVPAGCFQMGNEDGNDNEQPVHEVCFEEPFWIDVYEVTNAGLAAFLDSQGNRTEGDATWLDAGDSEARIHNIGGNWAADNGYGSRPAIEITWYGASAYCQWHGARLPTEAEWEYAARGPDGLIYPWGNDFVADNVVYSGNSGSRTAGVGSRPGGVSWVGAYDLSGNVWEWVNDWYSGTYYGLLADGAVNPQGPDGGEYRVLRGGAWSHYVVGYVHATLRIRGNPVDTSSVFGFRCARDD